MLRTFAKIEANKLLLRENSIPEEIIDNFRRKSLLKSSLFSAAIEGNTMTLSQAEQLPENTSAKEQLEVVNILRAFSFLQHTQNPSINRDFILQLHGFVMKDLAEKANLGKLRMEPSAIFNEAGFAVYVAPPPSDIPILLEQLIQFINSETEQNIPIRAILSHFLFEKIHPFLDGNGRVGRLLLQTILAKEAYHFHWLLSFEEILNERKSEYYGNLDTADPTAFTEFMLEVLFQSSEQVTQLIHRGRFNKEDMLLPRRNELLLLIREQQILSLDSIKRRFLKVPERTLRYDLQQLQKEGYILKVGATRGAMYRARNNF
ncbi:MAG TPA: Fic family protein [Patescibacteria group bacterium]|nr:Fic family protein [Patescibacteria group bacterium]